MSLDGTVDRSEQQDEGEGPVRDERSSREGVSLNSRNLTEFLRQRVALYRITQEETLSSRWYSLGQ